MPGTPSAAAGTTPLLSLPALSPLCGLLPPFLYPSHLSKHMKPALDRVRWKGRELAAGAASRRDSERTRKVKRLRRQPSSPLQKEGAAPQIWEGGRRDFKIHNLIQ